MPKNKKIDITGKTYGQLTVIKCFGPKFEYKNQQRIYWTCRCNCGKTVEVSGKLLRNGTTKSCGCLRSITGKIAMEKMKINRNILIKERTRKNYKSGFCQSCGNTIKKNKIYCNMKCYSKKRTSRITVSCINCNKLIEKTNFEILNNKYKNFYCSKQCSAVSHFHGLGDFQNIIRKIRRHTKCIKITSLDIKEQWDMQQGRCPYTGWLLKFPKYGTGKQIDTASLDRINSAKGYEKGNIQLVAMIANYAKNEFESEDLIRFCKAVSNHQNCLESTS